MFMAQTHYGTLKCDFLCIVYISVPHYNIFPVPPPNLTLRPNFLVNLALTSLSPLVILILPSLIKGHFHSTVYR